MTPPSSRLLGGRTLVAVLFALFLAAPRPASSEEDDPLAGLSGEKMRGYAVELAADAMQGRKTGFHGGQATEAWLQSKLGELGLDPMDPEGTYLQGFRFGTTQVVPPIRLAVEGKDLEYGTEYVDLVYTGAGRAEAEVVFVGYGIAAPDRGWDDYAGLDVKGKIVLAIRGAPSARESEFATERQIGWKSALAADRGAAGFLLAEGATATPGTIQERFHRAGLPALWVGSAVADRLLAPAGRTLAELKASRDAGEPGRSFGTGVTVALEVNGAFHPQAFGQNAVAGWHGKDPDLREEVILVGAHADHLGLDAAGRVYNGADDNASGSAVLVGLAETLINNRFRPRRTVVFAWFGGEEQGLVGSRHLVLEPPFPQKGIVAMLNLDMAGRGDGQVNLGGREAFPDLWDRFVAGQPEALRAKIHPFRQEPNSDHWPFQERGIPALFAHSRGEHPDYHKTTDDADRLQPEVMEAMGRALGHAVLALAMEPTPLAKGTEAAHYVLREGPRVVAATQADLLERLADPLVRAALVREGCAALAPVLEEGAEGDFLPWARLALLARSLPKELVLVRRAGDLANAARTNRLALLPCLRCAKTARALPGSLSLLHDLGVRWVDPFDPAVALEPARRSAVLEAAAKAGLVVDLTNAGEEGLAAALASAPGLVLTYRATAPWPGEPAAATTSLEALRRRLGPNVLLCLSGGAEAPLWATAGAATAEDPLLAPVVVLAADTASLAAALAPAEVGAHVAWTEPASPERARLRAWLGGAWVDWLRRLP